MVEDSKEIFNRKYEISSQIESLLEAYRDTFGEDYFAWDRYNMPIDEPYYIMGVEVSEKDYFKYLQEISNVNCNKSVKRGEMNE